MKNFNDKHTSLIKRKYEDRAKWSQENYYTRNIFPSNKEFKELNFFMERKFNDKIWWKLLSKDNKRDLIQKVFISGYDPNGLSKEQIKIINSIKERNPLTKEIRDYKLKLLLSN